jgi:hypothetical protein
MRHGAREAESRPESVIILLDGREFERVRQMSGKRVEEIERVIGTLTQEELEELRLWLDEYAGPRPIDRAIEGDLAAGRLEGSVRCK